jgi:hypothetical protein
MNDNYMPGDNGGSGEDFDPDQFSADEIADAFRAGAQQMREMLSRFVEQGPASDPKVIAQSMRLNWVPDWGKDPGPADDVRSDLWTALP